MARVHDNFGYLAKRMALSPRQLAPFWQNCVSGASWAGWIAVYLATIMARPSRPYQCISPELELLILHDADRRPFPLML